MVLPYIVLTLYIYVYGLNVFSYAEKLDALGVFFFFFDNLLKGGE